MTQNPIKHMIKVITSIHRVYVEKKEMIVSMEHSKYGEAWFNKPRFLEQDVTSAMTWWIMPSNEVEL